ncbi:MAG: ABC transporter ATP-binding protein [Chloroflexi bacterium]|nr:ABC transporter ATP-binding protein [Chloroflexota bacterium]MDA8189325.1 ABC transporter ATP-binding protein [Dehalococcoidales bacterium]
MALIEATGLTKQYNTNGVPVEALRNASLSIDAGEFIALMGPSGSGKSTLLSILGAMNPPTSGKLIVDTISVYDLTVEMRADFRHEYLGFVFQQLQLIPYLSAVENTMLPLAITRRSHKEQTDMAIWALERVGLADKAARLPDQLSGGEQGRVAIARAIVNEPPILLADEPTGSLDSRTGQEVMDLFKSLNEGGLTLIMVTHNPENAPFASRVVQIRDGCMIEGVGALR